MTVYAYKCGNCKTKQDVDLPFGENPTEFFCTICKNGQCKRDYSTIRTHRPMPTHMNPTTGMEVGSMRQFKDQLKVKSEEYFRRTGIEANFVPHDHNDTKALGVTNEGLDSTNAVRAERGLRPVVVPE